MTEKELFLEDAFLHMLKKAGDVVEAAKKEQADALNALEAELAAEMQGKLALAKSQAEAVLSRKSAQARLVSSKIMLTAKQEAIDDVIAAAKSHILGLPDKDYFEFIFKLIIKHSTGGEEVVFSKRDKSRVPKDFLQKFSANKLSITFSDKIHQGDGGVILEGEGYDKNLTVDVLFESVRDNIETELAELLFS